jgi:hypothetical protein
MRNSNFILVWLLSLSVSANCFGTRAQRPVYGPFSGALLQVRASTKIPILLSTTIPQPFGTEIHFARGSGDAKGYEITLYFEEGVGEGRLVFFGQAARNPTQSWT